MRVVTGGDAFMRRSKMTFQPPITIERALRLIQSQEYVLPAIQREFVWSEDQIYALFDSLMRGYPIGSFLSWKVGGSPTRDLSLYGFVKDYHERDAPHCPRLDIPPTQPVVAILDGQQRLTALNVGLRGSLAEKLPYKWRDSPGAYPVTRLYLNLTGRAEENESGLEYDFGFWTREEAAQDAPGEHWFEVRKILDLSAGPELFRYIQDAGLAEHPDAFNVLFKLHEVVHQRMTINLYEEEEQDLDRVLDIFVRLNSGGTPLSHSDLLLSIATAKWKDDAREIVLDFVDDLNRTGGGFNFTKDVVLKAGLVLVDATDFRFKVTNFGRDNMTKLETNWESVSNSIRLAAQLLADFGFSSINLRAGSILIPLAYYLHRREIGTSYLTGSRYAADRRAVRMWVGKALLKPGVWGSGLDTLLGALRTAIRDHGSQGFPVEEVEREMARLGKSLRFDDEALDDLADAAYGTPNAFVLLSLLFPGVDTRHTFHVDHVFPKKWFTPTRLRELMPDDQVDRCRRLVNGLANLQLLEGAVNEGKLDQLPMEWARGRHPDPQALSTYLTNSDMFDLPDDMTRFLEFYEARRNRLRGRIGLLLGVTAS